MQTKTTGAEANVTARKPGLVDKARVKLAGAADAVSHAASQTQTKLTTRAIKGRNRLRETAQKLGHAAQHVRAEAGHLAREKTQKVVDRAKEVAATAEHRVEELVGKPPGGKKRG
jgi:hypothetical protein